MMKRRMEGEDRRRSAGFLHRNARTKGGTSGKGALAEMLGEGEGVIG